MRWSRRVALAVVAGGIALPSAAQAQQIKAFPQAEGFGATALGGRGGDVYHVTKLNDDGSVGTLRYGVENAPSNGRTIVFDVGGWISLNSKLGLTRSRVTIAGHTAPGGIGIKNGQFSVGGDDVIVRHMRFRPGKITNIDHDSVNTNENAQRVIYDHISAEFSTDGGFDLQADEVTLQYSSVSYGLLTHSTGGLIQSPTGGAAGQLSFHHNLFAHNETRNPKARAELIDWRDNVVYNYHNGFLAGESETDVNPNWKANFDGNTYISNSGGNAGSGGRPMMTGGRTQNYDLWYGANALDRDADSADDPIVYTRAQAMTNQSVVSSAYNWSTTPFDVGDATVWQNGSPSAAYARVLEEFGATPWARDAINQLIHNQVLSRTGSRISTEAGLPSAGYPTLGGVAKPTDTDNDGMPDAWESRHGLSPTVASNNGDFDADGYTNLEEYLNDLGAFKAIGALEFDGAGRYADWSNWTGRWEPSRLDDVHVNTGTATVDAIGQKAGTLRIGATPGSNGTLAVQSGWLEVTNTLQVGPAGTGTVNQTGGSVIAGAGVTITNGAYNLSGGTLATPVLSKGPAGAFHFTGGTLTVGAFDGNLTQAGGTLDPAGTTTITGSYTTTNLAAAITIDIAGPIPGTQFDRVDVAGSATLAGVLRPQLTGATPAPTAAFTFLTFASRTGVFDAIENSQITPTQSWSVHYDNDSATLLAGRLTAAPVDGVFDVPGELLIDGAFTWTDSLVKLGAGDLVIDITDVTGVGPGAMLAIADGTVRLEGDGVLTLSALQFGDLGLATGETSLAGTMGFYAAVVPEPGSATLMLLAAAGLSARRRSDHPNLTCVKAFADLDEKVAGVRKTL
jgi:pectate lyase